MADRDPCQAADQKVLKVGNNGLLDYSPYASVSYYTCALHNKNESDEQTDIFTSSLTSN